ncbi:hypothetical protein CIHG_04136 [Coccidioides immitis H538.4]|uniref:Uncharacterized protein n=1 Tax=Coccidioides immitis H538.4 TaxID=396776 RepID=A0A0J8RNG4_COCIT|nr:hypothetical protein CIHG_04136 [Coccidioides immitis H538.4]
MALYRVPLLDSIVFFWVYPGNSEIPESVLMQLTQPVVIRRVTTDSINQGLVVGLIFEIASQVVSGMDARSAKAGSVDALAITSVFQPPKPDNFETMPCSTPFAPTLTFPAKGDTQ